MVAFLFLTYFYLNAYSWMNYWYTITWHIFNVLQSCDGDNFTEPNTVRWTSSTSCFKTSEDTQCGSCTVSLERCWLCPHWEHYSKRHIWWPQRENTILAVADNIQIPGNICIPIPEVLRTVIQKDYRLLCTQSYVYGIMQWIVLLNYHVPYAWFQFQAKKCLFIETGSLHCQKYFLR